MKNFLLLALFALTFTTLQAQKKGVRFGVRGGVSSTDLEAGQFFVTTQNGVDDLKVAIQDANYGYHAGLFLQARSKRLFIQPELLFNSNSVDFKVTDTNSEQAEQILTEKYNYLDMPLMMGVRLGPLRLQGGPVGHVFLNSKSELFEVEEYDQVFDRFTYGWQAGLGLDIWKFAFDLKYEGNFNEFGEHIQIGGQQYTFDQTPTRVVASVGIAF